MSGLSLGGVRRPCPGDGGAYPVLGGGIGSGTPADIAGRCRGPAWNPFLRTSVLEGGRWDQQDRPPSPCCLPPMS